ncbi:ABC transporter permease [Winogradskyella jejuensis]|uniref:Putative ABC transport system permease protein n=1 Tax=Winogradskyella jejuensis TaxID=1089305 RepID=A0A1M5KJY0_9FLAO|nr:ABC transporter permease [Winogradskyella jejuensis]SHG52970.1 putative ABC transport system permease protein [Winogradskyella jejuensis]
MIKNYFKIAWRSLVKNKVYSFINLSGLTIGMTCFILIAFYIQFESSFDKHIKDSDRIYRIVQQQKGNDYKGTDYFALAPLPLTTAIKQDFPEVESITNLDIWDTLIVNDNVSFSERGLFTTMSFFDVFNTPILEGDGKEALRESNTILLTESLAKKIFGEAPSIGKTVIHNKELLTVSGIVADPPKNQHFTYSFITSLKKNSPYDNDLTDWVSNNYYGYLKLGEGQDYEVLEKKISSYEDITKPAYKANGFQFYPKFSLQPLEDIHLYSQMNMEIETNGDIKYIYFFALLAIIILVLASVNYMNLATSRSAHRTKEVGVFKTLGARKQNLVFQYLSESIILTLFSFVVAFLLVVLLLPEFNKLLGKNILFNFFANGWLLVGMLFIAVLVGCLSGLYPAVFLSKINPVAALKGVSFKNHNSKSLLRNTLVVGQFIAAITLITGSIIISQQLEFIQEKKLGFNKEHIMHVSYFNEEIYNKEGVIRDALLNHPNINKVSISNQLPINVTSQGPIDVWEDNIDKQQLYVYRTYVDYEFLDLFEMNIVEGRGFSKEIASDSTDAYMLNEAALKKLGWKTAVGKKFDRGTVIGVVEDFHLQTFNLSIEPLYIRMRRERWNKNNGQIILKVKNLNKIENTIAFIEKTIKSVAPLDIVEVEFMDDTYLKLYEEEERLSKAFNLFSLLALFIAGMGLFGLVSFQVFQRTKEIGVRKVLGSTVFDIVKLVSKEFLKLILVAFIVATPMAYVLMSKWLQDYIYRIEIEWWVFACAGFIAVSIALITVILQVFKAATANPINALKTE